MQQPLLLLPTMIELTAVVTIPSNKPRNLVELSLPKMFSSLPPEIVVKLSFKIDMPNRNRTKATEHL